MDQIDRVRRLRSSRLRDANGHLVPKPTPPRIRIYEEGLWRTREISLDELNSLSKSDDRPG